MLQSSLSKSRFAVDDRQAKSQKLLDFSDRISKLARADVPLKKEKTRCREERRGV